MKGDENLEGTLRGYLNSQPFGEKTGVGFLYSHGDDAGIGHVHQNTFFRSGSWSNGNGMYFEGVIDEVAMYNKALPEDRILEIYNARDRAGPAPENVGGWDNGPVAFDWHIRQSGSPSLCDRSHVAGVDVVRVPHPGHDLPAGHACYGDLYDDLHANDRPLAIMLRNDTGPFHGSKDPGALKTVVGHLAERSLKLDYVFADFEGNEQEKRDNVLAMVSTVKEADPVLSDTWVGNYADYPRSEDDSLVWPHLTDRQDQHQFYLDSELNVAMPNAYPYEYYEVHARRSIWGDQIAPNPRAALFWAPLERVSVAARSMDEMPGGESQLLIPWLAGFIAWEGYEAPEPEWDDLQALTKHVRLRGADGYYTLTSGIEGYTNNKYVRDTSESWHSLDWLFESEDVEILNLETDKRSGHNWSGARVGNEVFILASNLGTESDGSFRVPLHEFGILGLPDFSDPVSVGTHRAFHYVVRQLKAGDANQDLRFDQFDILRVAQAAKYLTGQAATWGEGDWNGAPGGTIGSPPLGDGLFNQFDIIAAQQAGIYLTGPNAAIRPNGQESDGHTSVIYNAVTGEITVDAPVGTELTSINIDSAAGVFTGSAAENIGGSFDNDEDKNIFKATFGGSFGSLSFGNVAQAGLAEGFLLDDLIVVGSLHGGSALGDVDLIYVPEPSSVLSLILGAALLGVAIKYPQGACKSLNRTR